MFSAIQALLSLGKCRELPVAGFVDDMLVFGVIVSQPGERELMSGRDHA